MESMPPTTNTLNIAFIIKWLSYFYDECYSYGMKKVFVILMASMLALSGCSAEANNNISSAQESVSSESDMKRYDKDGLTSFIEHGTGVVLLEGTDENSKRAEEMVKKAGDENGVTPSFYKVEDEMDEDLIYLINSHNVSRVKMLGDTIETPILLFIEEGMIQTYFMADDFESDEISAMLTESMSELSDYMKANEKDACDSGCKLG